jgi:hypothetical protein
VVAGELAGGRYLYAARGARSATEIG